MCSGYSQSALYVAALVFVFLSLLPTTFAGATNRTIDDYYGDSVTGVVPVYSANWNAGQLCEGCGVKPNPSLAFDGTWRDTTSNNPVNSTNHSVTITFTGTAVWIYFIVVNNATAGVTILTNATFTLDDALAGTYTHPPAPVGNPVYQYNVSAFSNTALSNTSHTLVVSAVQGAQASLLLFDYAVYTFDDGSESSMSTPASTVSQTASSSGTSPASTSASATNTRSSVNVGAIAGGVVGGVGGVVALVAVLVYCRRRQRRGTFHAGHAVWDDQLGSNSVMAPFMEQAPLNQSSSVVEASPEASALSSNLMTGTFPVPSPNMSSPGNGGHGEKLALTHQILERENLRRQAEDLRQRLLSMRALQSTASPVPTNTTSVSVMSRSERDIDEELRAELVSLREEMARLRVETERAVREPPPAYV